MQAIRQNKWYCNGEEKPKNQARIMENNLSSGKGQHEIETVRSSKIYRVRISVVLVLTKHHREATKRIQHQMLDAFRHVSQQKGSFYTWSIAP